MRLSESIAPQGRFSRSINVERDTSRTAIDGYLPTGRALDVVKRVGRSLTNDGSGRAFSITGPHGSGKSSLAVFLSGLTAPGGSDEYAAAHETLATVEPETAQLFTDARSKLDAADTGFVRCVVTAGREPVMATVARSFAVGAERFFGGSNRSPIPADWTQPDFAARLSPRDIHEQLGALTGQAPLLLVIDEFGKNLEAYADSGREGDPYLLQELAEWAGSGSSGSLVVITMQHLAFEEYVHETSTARRREWVKVQGRFEDIAYVETASQARALVGAAFSRTPGPLDGRIASWIRGHRAAYASAGLRDLFEDEVAARAYPIHPMALATLPELCSRYGQNERTLFSFLAGPEPQAVPAFLAAADWSSRRPLPFVRLADVYDYFVASAATMIGSAAAGSRWVEIESRIRDTPGLGDLELKALKSIGVLNLISAGGTVRASRSILGLALSDDATSEDVAQALGRLEDRGLVTYRDFADEYRIWQGSDFDLKGVVETARRRCATRSLDELLNEAAPLSPLVAARHSQQFGTLRIFERRFSQFSPDDLVPPAPDSEWDGRVLLSVVDEPPEVSVSSGEKPVVAVLTSSIEGLEEIAVDAAALAEALQSAESADADWVARRELIERFAAAQQRLQVAIESAFGAGRTDWHLIGSDTVITADYGSSSVLSEICDRVYSATPHIPNEMISRRELTSQGAKARRILIEAILTKPASPRLGIDGYPAERAMYEALLARPGLHVIDAGGLAKFRAPKDRAYRHAWRVIQDALNHATEHKVDVRSIWRSLQAPPIGLKDGPIPILLVIALLLRQDDVALYEHGTLVLALDEAVAERFVRNPGHFAVKNTAATSAARSETVAKLATRLGYSSYTGAPTFLGVARRLFAQLRRLEPYAIGTSTVSSPTAALRKAFRSASEPDRLVFQDLPTVLGFEPIPAGRASSRLIDDFVEAVGQAIDELEAAYPTLLNSVKDELARALREAPTDFRRSLSVQASALRDSVLEPRLRSFVIAATRDELDDTEWLENLAMVVADAPAPKNWNDDIAERFRLAATEVGGSFRRVSALISERKVGLEDHGDALPLAVTRFDGREGRMVLWVTEEQRQVVSPRLRNLLEDVTPLFGSAEKAREVLLAALLGDSDDTVNQAATVDLPEAGRMREARHGQQC